ncbi:MAG: CNP1-like family protein [Burkholderiales bacterium]|nr:CNP1-like family protein [Burkholderiales bacterium]
MNNKRLITWILLTVLLLLLIACAAKKEFKDEFDAGKTWVEQLAQLPDFPDLRNLIKFDVGSITDYSHAIDPDSISIGQDGVIRFTLVTRSSTGVMNISYEGIRCITNERKLYAIGRDDHTWSEPRVSDWQSLDFVRQFYAQRELSKNLFCPHKQIVNSREEAIRVLRKGIHPDIYR